MKRKLRLRITACLLVFMMCLQPVGIQFEVQAAGKDQVKESWKSDFGGKDGDRYESVTDPDGEEIAVTGVSVTPEKVTVGVGETFQLKAYVIPNDATDKTLTFTASNNNVTVTPKGVVRARAVGLSQITVRSSNGKYAVVDVVVKKAPGKITLNAEKKNLKVGKTFQIKVKLPENTASSYFLYSSSNKSVAVVSSSGKVTARKKGTAFITVKTYNGKQTQLKVTVTEEGKLKAPSLTVKLNSANGVKLSWKKVSGAEGYYVYRSTSKNSGYKQIKKLKGTSYINNKLKSGKTYYYKVAAYKGSTLSAKSKAKSKKIIGKPGRPNLRVEYAADNQVLTISWNNVKRATHIEILCQYELGVYKTWKSVPVKNRKAKYSLKGIKKGKIIMLLRAYYIEDGQKICGENSNSIILQL